MTTPIRRYPIGVQNFEKLITSGYAYVDKTELVYKLLQSGEAAFLSRPRRFGKSLLVSTLKAYFEGKKELFKGLAMESLEEKWTQHPVLHIDLSSSKSTEVDKFKSTVNNLLAGFERLYGSVSTEETFGDRLAGIISRAAEQSGAEGKVVVLIDEYDAPLLGVLHDDKERKAFQEVLRNLFSPLKFQGHNMSFLFITGITKFSQLSIFSELNHLLNISMLPQFSAICGITEEELLSYFKEDITLLAENNSETYAEACAHLKRLYDGYHFSEDCPDIYNPYSLIKVLYTQRYDSYWFESATPTFLLNLLQLQQININELEGAELDTESFNAPITDTLHLIPTFYHSGYLTIKSFDNVLKTYTIGIPNEEVRVGLVKSLIPRLLPHVFSDKNLSAFHFARDLMKGDIEMFLVRLRSFFGDIPHHLNNKCEKHYQTIFYVFVVLMGQYAQVEHATAIGRIDLLIRTSGYLYLFEFKRDSTAKAALAQINEKEYALPYKVGNDQVIKIGINFDDTTRTISEWVVE